MCEDDMDFTIMDNQEQVLTCSIKLSSDEELLISIVYVKTKSDLRVPLWNDLRRLYSSIIPWCVSGDFNCITEAQEKERGLPHKHQKSIPFINCIPDCDLVDMNFSGSKFTWCNDGPRIREFVRGLIGC